MVLKSLLLTLAIAVPAAAAAADDGILHLTAATSSRSATQLCDGGDAWAGIPEQPIHLNRSPALYEGDPTDDGARPEARVSMVHSGDLLLVRLLWTDSTESRPADPVAIADAGHETVYKKHSLDIERFADAACVMIPKTRGGHTAYPALMMGERNAPVDLYYWHHVRGFQIMQAAGRATTTPTGQSFPGSARRTDHGWEVVFELPAVPPLTPLCFAVWDGDRSQRDGLKYYSLWYEVAS